MLVTKFNQFVEARRRQRAIVNIRREFLKAGYPLDHFGDSQIEAALTRCNDDISAVTVSAKTIYRTLKRLRMLPVATTNSESMGEVFFPGR
jgi:hypothetical protein